MKKAILFIIINCQLLIVNCLAQSFDNIWIIGYANTTITDTTVANMDITFQDTGNAAISTSNRNIRFTSTNACISDSVGNFLFNTNGIKINNRQNQLMVNGAGLNPGTLTNVYSQFGLIVNQGAIIVPQPTTSKYVLFHNTPEYIFGNTYLTPIKLYYSIIDMSLDNGNGAVTQKNQILFNDTLAYGMLTACRHANGRDWWVVVPKWNSNKYYKILITPNGIENYTMQAFGPSPSRRDYSGQIAFSPDGSKYARCDIDSGLILLDFDRCTGMFTNYFKTMHDTTHQYSGLAFSPNSKLLYISATTRLYQYNLEATNIAASKDTIAIWDGFCEPTNSPFCATFYTMQNAPNGKIYMCSTNGLAYMHVINKPDSIGTNCDFIQHGISLPHYTAYELPNLPNYHLGALVGSGCDTLLTSRSLAAHSLRVGRGGPNPNPANNSFYYNYSVKEICTLQITNSSGLVVHTQTLYPWFGYVIIESATWSNGVYVAALKNKGGNVISNHKVVVLHE